MGSDGSEHYRSCGGLLGCGDGGGRSYMMDGDTVEAALTPSTRDRLALGLHRDLSEAFRIALRNTIAFLHRRAGLSRHDAYGLASMAVNFRITQVVDVNQGVHAMIPKDIFARELRRRSG